jgi:NADPH-dependent 2,4-dienoyl-CoA reductase/sulfur reductase-like enzyme/nitrite reductase/ring-hydroxylating ferredoxin subunit
MQPEHFSCKFRSIPVQITVNLSDLAEVRITKAMLGETPVVLIRVGDAVRAFGGECPHAGAPLEEGAICNGRLICPWHKATFRIDDGALVEPPALDALTRYDVRIDRDRVTISSEALAPPSPARRVRGRIAAIVGSGAAGAAAASALREGGYDGRVLLIGPEALQPYDRTALSKFVVAGEMAPADVPPLRAHNDWQALDVEQIDATVTRLDAGAKTIHFADGETLAYDTALIATGGAANRPKLPGIGLQNVRTLRNIYDAEAILAEAGPGANVVVMGSSFIGLEAASALRQRGANVAVVGPETIPFARQFGDRIGTMVRRLHEANGVSFHLGTEIVRLDGDDRVREAVLKNGTRLAADCVVVGAGVAPVTDFVNGVEKAKDGGILVDAGMRAAESLFVAGDCARFPYHGNRVRIEHWRVAQQHARVAAQGMIGNAATYEGVPFFWTYHYGKNIEYLGHADHWDELHIDGDIEAQDFAAFQMLDGIVAGVVACGRETATARLIESMRSNLTLAQARAAMG